METFIPVVTKKCSVKVWPGDVLYIEKKGRKVIIFVEGGQFDYYEKIENIDQYLDKRFCKCRKTLIINMEKVDKMEEPMVVFRNGEQIILGRDCFIRSKQIFTAFLKNYI